MSGNIAAHLAAWGKRWPHVGYGLPEAGSPRQPVTFPLVPLGAKAEFAFNADLSADPSTWDFTDVTDRLRTEGGVSVRFGRSNEATTADPTTLSCAFNNFDGHLTPRNPASPYPLRRGTPFRFSIDPGSGPVERFSGFASVIKPQWLDQAANVPIVAFEAAGILRRLGQGAAPLKSPIYRVSTANDNAITVANRKAYWPLEDASGALTIASGLPGGAAMTYTGRVGFASYEGIPGSDRIATLGDGGELTGLVPSYTSTMHKATAVWSLPADGLSDGAVLQELYYSGGTVTLAKLRWWLGGSLSIDVYTGSTVHSGTVVAFGVTADFTTSVELRQSGSDVIARIFARRISLADPSDGGVWDDTHAGQTVNGGGTYKTVIGPGGLLDGVSVGHVTVLSHTSALSGAGGMADAVYGYDGETASERLDRLCTEEGIPLVLDNGATSTMGPQRTETLLELLRECEAADHGLLVEHNFGLRYIPRIKRYNAAVTLTLSASGGHLWLQPQPVEDDQGIRNDVTASRPKGSSSRYEDTDHIDQEGRYNAKLEVNVPDSELDHHAEWLAHLGTIDDMRYPQLSINLAAPRSVGLIDHYLETVPGGRAQVADLPTAILPNGIDVFIDGATEQYNLFQWDVEANCVPARPYDMFTIESPEFGALEAGSSSLAAAISDSDTALSVATASGPLWTLLAEYPADFPLDIEVVDSGQTSGERMRVTDITGASSPQAFTVQRGLNNVQVTHAAGATVRLWRGGQIAL